MQHKMKHFRSKCVLVFQGFMQRFSGGRVLILVKG